MQSNFWSNTVWYLALFIISLILLVITIIKSKNRKPVIAFYFAIMGLIYYIETIILAVYESYSYYPQVFNGTYDDIILGNLVSHTVDLINWPFELLRIQYFTPGFVADPIRDHIIGYFIYSFFLINIFINLYKLKVGWLRKIPVFITLYFVQMILVKSGLLYIKEEWFFVCTTIAFAGYYFFAFMMDNFIKSREGVTQVGYQQVEKNDNDTVSASDKSGEDK